MTDDYTARNKAIVRQRHGGAKIAEIARKHALSSSRISAILRELDPDLSTGQGIKLHLDDTEIAETYRDGATVRAIADDLDVSYGTIYRILQAQRVQMRPRGGRYTR